MMYLAERKTKLVPQNTNKQKGRSVGLCKYSTSVKRKVLARNPKSTFWAQRRFLCTKGTEDME